MKIKADFVTNSSSASFILFVEVLEPIDQDQFEENWQKYLDYYYNEYSWILNEKVKDLKRRLKNDWKHKLKFEKKEKDGTLDRNENLWLTYYKNAKNPNSVTKQELIKKVLGHMEIKPISSNVFSVEYFTSMFNGIACDVPPWMIHLIVLSNMKDPDLLKFGIKDVKLKIQQDGG